MKKLITLISLMAMYVLLTYPMLAQNKAPAKIAAVLTVKLASFNKNISGDVSIHVMGDKAIADQLKKLVGKKVGGGTLKNVTSGAGVPSNKPSMLFFASGDVAAATAYTRKNKILSVTNDPTAVSNGITLGITVGANGKPKILLNLTGSSDEDINWNPAIMKVAKTLK